MAKRQKTEIDEGLIRKMIAGEASPREKSNTHEDTSTKEPPELPDPSEPIPELETATADAPAVDELPQSLTAENHRRRTMPLPDYELTFLQPVNYDLRAFLYVSRATKLKILEIVKKIGNERLTATSFVDNILRQHLAQYKEEINRIYEERGKKDLF